MMDIRDKAHGYLSRCLQALYPKIEILPDLLGVCTQIDNVLAGQQAEIEKLRAALKQARRDALEEAMEIAFKERFCVERYETSPPQAVAAHNIIEAIRALGEKE
jgi:hypothetical protein